MSSSKFLKEIDADDEIKLASPRRSPPRSPDCTMDAQVARTLNEQLNGVHIINISSDSDDHLKWKDVRVKKEEEVKVKKEDVKLKKDDVAVKKEITVKKEKVRRAACPNFDDDFDDFESDGDHKRKKAKISEAEKRGAKHRAEHHEKKKRLKRRLKELKRKLHTANAAAPPALPAAAPPAAAAAAAVAVVPPPPSVAPPTPADAKQPARRGRKPKRLQTADDVLHVAKAFCGPQWRTPTVALSYLHRGHLLLDVYSADSLRHMWTYIRTNPNSAAHNDAVAAQLGYAHTHAWRVCEVRGVYQIVFLCSRRCTSVPRLTRSSLCSMSAIQRNELRDLIKSYEEHQVVLATPKNAAPVEPLIAAEMAKRAKKEKQQRKEAKEARGETVGKSLLQASQDLVTATKDAMTMYRSLHRKIMEKLEENHGHLSSDDSSTSVSEYEDSSSSSASSSE